MTKQQPPQPSSLRKESCHAGLHQHHGTLLYILEKDTPGSTGLDEFSPHSPHSPRKETLYGKINCTNVSGGPEDRNKIISLKSKGSLVIIFHPISSQLVVLH